MLQVIGPFNSGAAAGSAGSATANADSAIKVNGLIVGVYVKYNDSPPAATCDVTVATKGVAPAAPARTILAIVNAATDGWFFPRVQVCDTAGAAIASTYDYIPVDDKINVNIAQANAADNVDVWLLVAD